MLTVTDNQVRSLRKRQAVDSYIARIRAGAYWGIRTDIAKYHAQGALPAPFAKTIQLANLGTNLSKTPARTQEQLINWGYAVCDAAMRKYVLKDGPVQPAVFHYPNRAEADAHAAQLASKNGVHHFVEPAKVPME